MAPKTPEGPKCLSRRVASVLSAAENLDALAREGCTQGNLYIGAFPCSPSRACQLKGRYLHNHRVITNDVLLPENTPTLGSMLRDQGYATGCFGPGQLKTAQAGCRKILQWTRETGHPYAHIIAKQAAPNAVESLLDSEGRIKTFEYAGTNPFLITVAWKVNRDIAVEEGKYWAFTQLLNPKYGNDSSIVFRFTPYPDPPFGKRKHRSSRKTADRTQ